MECILTAPTPTKVSDLINLGWGVAAFLLLKVNQLILMCWFSLRTTDILLLKEILQLYCLNIR